jgi:hypothetical protein
MSWPASMIATPDAYDVDAVTRIIREACDDYEPGWSTTSSGTMPATYTGGPRLITRSQSRIYDNADGRCYPFYEQEQDLIRERNKWRGLAGFTSVAIGAMTALQCYTMGGEWEYEVEPREGCQPPPDLLKEANRILKEILERNNFVGGLDNEIHDQSREDGESPVAVYATHDGLAEIRLMRADNIRTPLATNKLNDWLDVRDRDASWSFGVLTRFNPRQQRIDHERHVGYHVVFEDSGKDWDYLPAWPQSHGDDDLDGKFLQFIKRNTPRAAKRGVSDYWPVLTDLEQEAKLNVNTNVGLAVQAAIAWWEEMPPNASKEQVASQMSAALDNFSQRLTNQRGGERSINNMRPGTVPKISSGRKIIAGPMGQQRSPLFLEGRNAIMRRIGLRWLMPEYMITGDASNSNFASTLVAESPFVKAREADQRVFVAHFKELFTKCLKIAFDAGRFDRYVRNWRDFARMVDIRIQPPMVATRDKEAMLKELTDLWDRGILDSNEVLVETRRDAKAELAGKTGDPSMMLGKGNQDGQQQGQPMLGAGINLNGAQITAASNILQQVASGQLPEIAGSGLLNAVGLPPDMTQQMTTAASDTASQQQQLKAAQQVNPQEQTRLAAIEAAVRVCKTIEEARAVVRERE